MSDINSVQKVGCNKLKSWLLPVCNQLGNTQQSNHTTEILILFRQIRKELNKYSNHLAETEIDENVLIQLILDVRTYICASGKSASYNNYKHCRLSNYNFKKIQKIYIKLNKKVEAIIENIIKLWLQKTKNIKTRVKYINFVKETTIEINNNTTTTINERIENVFTKIDQMAIENGKKS